MPCFRRLRRDMDDYEKLKALYESIVTGTEYDLQAPENRRSVPFSFMEKASARDMRKAFQYLCQRAGIPAVLVTGTVEDGTPHAWTAVCCSGEWYYADPSWGDVSYQTEGAKEDGAEGKRIGSRRAQGAGGL